MDGKFRKARIKFFLNIVLPSIFAVLLFVVTLFFIVIPSFEKSMMDRKREMITELTNTATSILDKYHKDELDGTLTREEAQETAISRIEYLRYGEENKDYFWITDMQPVMIVHPYRPDLNGENLSDFEDSHGKKMFIEFVKIVKDDKHGYVEYMWQWKDDSTQIVPKLSYVKAFEPWGWIVGTGIYIEDVKSEIAGLTNRFLIISIIISVIIALILTYVGRQSFNIERKRIAAEKELNESREKYRSMVEASTEGLLMYIDNKVSFVNAVFEKMMNLKSDEIINLDISSILKLSEDIKGKLTDDNYTFNQVSLESLVHGKNDTEIEVLLNINHVDFYGRKAIIFSVKDISSNKQVEEELIESKEKFQSLMDKLNQGLFRTSMDTKGRFIEANQTALNIFGYKTFSDISDLYIMDFFVEKSDKKTFKENLLKQGFVKNQIVKLRNKNGEHILASVSLAVIFDNKQPKFCDGIIQDITMKRAVEAQPENNNSEFASFMQTLFRPLISFAKPALVCQFDIKVAELAKQMTEESVEFAIVAAQSGELLGYVTDEIIRKRALLNNELVDLQVFSIMNSPIKYFSENRTVFDALNEFSIIEGNFMALKNKDNVCATYLDKSDLLILQEFFPAAISKSIEASKSINELKFVHDKFISSLLPVIQNGTKSSIIFKNLSFISDLSCIRIIELGIEKLGNPPVEFSFITLGSEGRREQTLSTDQDNAIIYADVEESKTEETKLYFDSLAKFVCDGLDKIGYEHCIGGIMAMNPEYCQPISVWKMYFNKWVNKGNGKDLLDISVFFDFRHTYGNESFAIELKKVLKQLTTKNPAYLLLLAQNNLKLKPQVGFWGNILLETAGSPPETVNIKEAIMPITSFARIYALKYNLTDVSTLGRMKKLNDAEIIGDSSYLNIVQAYEYLQSMRLKHQAILMQNGLSPDNLINTNLLSELDKEFIKKVLSQINTMLSKLSYDFKGTM